MHAGRHATTPANRRWHPCRGAPVRMLFRWCRYAQPPATSFHPFGMRQRCTGFKESTHGRGLIPRRTANKSRLLMVEHELFRVHERPEDVVEDGGLLFSDTPRRLELEDLL